MSEGSPGSFRTSRTMRLSLMKKLWHWPSSDYAIRPSFQCPIIKEGVIPSGLEEHWTPVLRPPVPRIPKRLRRPCSVIKGYEPIQLDSIPTQRVSHRFIHLVRLSIKVSSLLNTFLGERDSLKMRKYSPNLFKANRHELALGLVD